MNIKSNLIVLCFSIFLLSSCLDITRCSNDDEMGLNFIYAYHLENESLEVIYEYQGRYGYRDFIFYGISPDSRYIYYPLDYISFSNSIRRFDTETNILERWKIDTYMGNPALSPDGTLFAYQNESGYIALSDVEGDNPRLAPGSEGIFYINNLEWSTNPDHLIVQSVQNNPGIFLIDLADSTNRKLVNASSYFNLSMDGTSLVYADDGIKVKNLDTGEILQGATEGNYPKFVNGDQMVMTEGSYQVFLSEIGGQSQTIIEKNRAVMRSWYQNLIVSNARDRIFINEDGHIQMYTFDGQGLKTLVTSEMFYPDDADEWSSVRVYINRLMMSPDDSKLYFLVSLSYYRENC